MSRLTHRSGVFILCSAAAVLQLAPASALAQEEPETVYPSMEPPPDYVEMQHERERTACNITGACQESNQAPRNRNPDWYSALAFSNNPMRAGSSHGQGSSDAANQQALAVCRRNGGVNCKVVIWRANQCIGYAYSSPEVIYSWDADPDRGEAWRKALLRCRNAGGKQCNVLVTACGGDDPRWPSPLPLPPPPAGAAITVDPHVVGTWEILINPGYWVLRIARNGTYEFHSEAPDGVGPHAGTFSAHDGHWSLHATNGYSDEGTYSVQSPDSWTTTGRRGTGTWRHLRGDQ
jgi:hypothetical protein